METKREDEKLKEVVREEAIYSAFTEDAAFFLETTAFTVDRIAIFFFIFLCQFPICLKLALGLFLLSHTIYAAFILWELLYEDYIELDMIFWSERLAFFLAILYLTFEYMICWNLAIVLFVATNMLMMHAYQSELEEFKEYKASKQEVEEVQEPAKETIAEPNEDLQEPRSSMKPESETKKLGNEESKMAFKTTHQQVVNELENTRLKLAEEMKALSEYCKACLHELREENENLSEKLLAERYQKLKLVEEMDEKCPKLEEENNDLGPWLRI